jgi:4-amino-4-deoxy-L-arabinose transferase-like glycosyltransferase
MLNKSLLNKIFLVLIVFAFSGYHLRSTFLDRGNSHTYLNLLAYNVCLHHQFSIATGIPSVDYEPLYPMVMGVAYSLSGNNWLALTIIQALLHALTSVMIFSLALRLWNYAAGFFAGAMHIVYPYFFSYSLSIYDTTLFVFCVTAALYFALKNNFRKKDLVFSGVFIGLAFLTRATIVTFLPGIFLYVFIKSFQSKTFFIAIKNCGIILIATFIIMFPWLYRNHHYTQRWLISTHGSFGLWEGNNDYSYEYLKKNISLDEIYRRNPPPEIYRRFPLTQRSPQEAATVADAYKTEATSWIKNHQSEFIQLAFLKAQKLWTWNRNPSSSTPRFGSNEGRQWTNRIAYLPLLILFPFGLFFLYKKNNLAAIAFTLTIICFTTAHMIAIGFTRARLPLDVVLMILFGIALSEIINKFSEKKFSLTNRKL